MFKSLDPLAIIILAPESSTLLATPEVPDFFGTGNGDNTGLYFKPSGMALTQPSAMCSPLLSRHPARETIRRVNSIFCSENQVQAVISRPSYPATQTLLDRC